MVQILGDSLPHDHLHLITPGLSYFVQQELNMFRNAVTCKDSGPPEFTGMGGEGKGGGLSPVLIRASPLPHIGRHKHTGEKAAQSLSIQFSHLPPLYPLCVRLWGYGDRPRQGDRRGGERP